MNNKSKNIKTNLFFLIVIFTLVISVNTISASELNINSFLLRSDSSDSFLNIQYGSYYDNIDLKVNFGLSNLNGYNVVPVLISPKLYGINNYGDVVLLDVLPTVNYNIYNSNPETYLYNNLFYVQPDYSQYMVLMNINSLDNSYSASDIAYIYVDQTINPETYIPGYGSNTGSTSGYSGTSYIDDFYLSGQQHIYLDEDDSEDYKIYINNLSDKTLEIVAVTTSDPSRLDIEDIDYPNFVSPGNNDYINIELTSDSVSSDYTGEFEVNVIARFSTQDDLEKQVTIVYHIEDEDTPSNADCDELDLENYKFSINDNSIIIKDITLENNSNDYYFEIDTVEVENNSVINTNILSFDDFINEEESGLINLEFISDDIDSQTRENIELKIKGYLKRNNTSKKRCTIRKDLKITVENNFDNTNNIRNNTFTNCSNIKVFAPNIIQEENSIINYNKNNGFFLINTSNKTFTINNIIVSDNSAFANITKNTIENKIYAQSDLGLNFDLSTIEINNLANTTKASVSVSGTFSDGTICNSGDIKKYFNLDIVDNNDRCSKVGVYSKIVNSGKNNIKLFNNTTETFYVEDFLIDNRFNLETNIYEDQYTINSNSDTIAEIGFIGSGTVQLLIKGRFQDGTICNFNETQSGTFNSTNINTYNLVGNNSCISQLDVPNYLEIDDASESYDISFINESSNGGKIIISGNGVVSNPAIIYLDGYDNFSKEINISNFSNPKSVFYKVILNGCDSDLYFTNLEEKINVADRIQFVSYPTVIEPSSRNIQVALQLKNSYNNNQEVTIKLSGFPSSWHTSQKILSLEPRTIIDTYLGIIFPENASKINYNGYIDLYKDNIKVNSIPLTINLGVNSDDLIIETYISKDSAVANIYLINVYLENNSNSSKDYILDFNLSDDFIIQGDTNVFLLADENKSINYKIASPYVLEDGYIINLKIKDSFNNKELLTKEIVFKKENNSYLTGFLVFNNTMANVVFILIILIILFLIYKKLRLVYIRKHTKYGSSHLVNSKYEGQK